MFFLTLIVIGLTGLAMMAIPGLNRHGHAGAGHSGVHVGHAHSGFGGHHASHTVQTNAAKKWAGGKYRRCLAYPPPRAPYSASLPCTGRRVIF